MAPSRVTGNAIGGEAASFGETIPLITENGRSSGVVTDVESLNTLVGCIATLEDLLQNRLGPAQAAAQATLNASPLRTVKPAGAPAAEKSHDALGPVIQAVKTAVTLASVAPIIQTSSVPATPKSSAPRLHAVRNEPVSIPPAPRPVTVEKKIEAKPAEKAPVLRSLSMSPAPERASAPAAWEPSSPPSFVPPVSFAPRSLGRLPRSEAPDIVRLLSTFGCPEFAYREVSSFERASRSAAEANIALSEIVIPGTALAAQTGSLVIEPTSDSGDARSSQPSRRRRSMVEMPSFRKDPRIPWTVAVVSTRPGAGRTSVVAGLAMALAQDSHRAVAVELDPRNDLPAHFGLNPAQRFGLANESVPLDHLRWHQSGVSCVPYGATDQLGQAHVEAALADDERWLEKRLLPLAAGDSDLWVLDAPLAEGRLLRQALSLADLVLVIVTPDVESAAMIGHTDNLLTEQFEAMGKPAPCYVLNRFDARRPIDRLAHSLVRGEIRERLAPTIHEDVSVQEALDAGRLLVQTASQSQVVADFAALADWLNSRRSAGAAPSRS